MKTPSFGNFTVPNKEASTYTHGGKKSVDRPLDKAENLRNRDMFKVVVINTVPVRGTISKHVQ